MRRRSSSSESSRVTPAATAAGSPESTRIPVSPSRTASGTPPERPPTTTSHHDDRPAQELVLGPAPEARPAHFGLEQQQLRSVDRDAVRQRVARAQPARRMARGFELAAPSEAGPMAPHQPACPHGPEEQTVDGAEPVGADRGVVYRLGKSCIARRTARVAAGRDDERSGGVAQRQLAHLARDAAAVRRKVEGEEEGGTQAGTRPRPSTTSASIARRSRTTRSQL